VSRTAYPCGAPSPHDPHLLTSRRMRFRLRRPAAVRRRSPLVVPQAVGTGRIISARLRCRTRCPRSAKVVHSEPPSLGRRCMGAQGDDAVDFRSMVVGSEVDVDTVLGRLGLAARQQRRSRRHQAGLGHRLTGLRRACGPAARRARHSHRHQRYSFPGDLCAAPCDCVFVDRTGPRARKYCCDQCNDRAAAAAYYKRNHLGS